MQNSGPAVTISCKDVRQALRIQRDLLAGIKLAVRNLRSCAQDEPEPGAPDDTEASTGYIQPDIYRSIDPGADCLHRGLDPIGPIIMPSADCTSPDFRRQWREKLGSEPLAIDDAMVCVEALLELPWAALSSFPDDHSFELRRDLEPLGRRPTTDGEARR